MWNCGIVELRDIGIAGWWNCGMVEFWDRGIAGWLNCGIEKYLWLHEHGTPGGPLPA